VHPGGVCFATGHEYDDVLFVLEIGKTYAGFSILQSNLLRIYFRQSLIKK